MIHAIWLRVVEIGQTRGLSYLCFSDHLDVQSYRSHFEGIHKHTYPGLSLIQHGIETL